MLVRTFILLLAGLMLWAAPVSADDPAATLYDDETLAIWGERYARSSDRILREGLFPELNPDKFMRVQGMNITFVTSTSSDAEARQLLTMLGMPYRREEQAAGAA